MKSTLQVILDQLPFEKKPRSGENMDYFVGAKHAL